jgi:hypothetical protein
MVCGLVLLGQSQLVGNREPEKKSAKKGGGREAEFKAFQRQWLAVYLLTMLADWLQVIPRAAHSPPSQQPNSRCLRFCERQSSRRDRKEDVT